MGKELLPKGAQPDAVFDLHSAWSYICGRCGACCKGRDFLVNPFDVDVLAAALGLSPAQVLARHIDPSRPMLRWKADETCTFFATGAGCSIHAGRPAVCRLYPLGRHVGRDRVTRFAETSPVPGAPGLYGVDGTIADYLAGQEAQAHIEALGLLQDFINQALTAAARAGVLAEADGAVAAYASGEGGPLPAQFMDVTALADHPPTADHLVRLSAHLDALAELCGVRLGADAQRGAADTEEGRRRLARLIVMIAVLGASLGLAPGFSVNRT